MVLAGWDESFEVTRASASGVVVMPELVVWLSTSLEEC